MDFSLSEEQQAIFDMAHDFGQSAIAPHAIAWDDAWRNAQRNAARGRRAGGLPAFMCLKRMTALGYLVLMPC